MMTIIVTGGAGFIGSNFIRQWLSCNDEALVNLDKLTYAGNLNNLSHFADDPRHIFVRGDIGDQDLIAKILSEHRVRAVVNFAAETHVDRSIGGPDAFIQTNMVGTFHLLEAVRTYWDGLTGDERTSFRFLHVSTDEVYGSLSSEADAFTEISRFAPNSPYSASKASSDHLVRAYHHTYGLPVLTSNCSNNYGPYQFPEKLIPLMICRAVEGKPLPIYGDGLNIRDWLYVEDHCDALRLMLAMGKVGETYNIGGWNELSNLEVVHLLCDLLDTEVPRPDGLSYRAQITHIADRPGHDRRYAIDCSKIMRDLGWAPKETFSSGIARTVRWYLSNMDWVRDVTSGAYRHWIAKQYGR